MFEVKEVAFIDLKDGDEVVSSTPHRSGMLVTTKMGYVFYVSRDY